jgi:trimeric autotransporter adhesin
MANGYQALASNTTGYSNTADGASALISSTTGVNNTASGFNALFDNTTGSNNTALGAYAGSHLTTGSGNIDINNAGVAGESDTIRIGNTQSATYIAGISGQTASQGTLVFINSDGKLGTMVSSRRFKKEIKAMDQASEAILELKPVSFQYKSDSEGTPQFGLIAEEVAKVDRDLVLLDKEGKPYTVRYEAVNLMLLNEFLKEHRNVQELEATVAQQQKEIQALTASLKEQASQIQKVSAQLKVSKPAPQMVINNP